MKSRAKSATISSFRFAGDVEGAVGDLDVREPVLDEPPLELVEPAASVDRLEERATAHDRRVERPVERDLLLEVVRDVGGAPAELDDVDEGARGVEEALDVADVQPLVDHVREALDPGLARPGG